MEELLKELIEFVKSASPMVWTALIKQVYVYAIQNLVWGLLFLVASIASGRTMIFFINRWIAINKGMDDGESEYYHYSDVPTYVMGCSMASVCVFPLLVALALGTILEGASRLINPEFYAIQLILKQLR